MEDAQFVDIQRNVQVGWPNIVEIILQPNVEKS